MSRIAIGLMFALLLALAGGLLSIPLLVRDPLPIVGPQSPITIERDGNLPIVARLQVDPSGRFVMLFGLEAVEGAEHPRLHLSMPDHEMTPAEATVESIGQGRFRATGILPMPGRWEASLRQSGAEQTFQFILREF